MRAGVVAAHQHMSMHVQCTCTCQVREQRTSGRRAAFPLGTGYRVHGTGCGSSAPAAGGRPSGWVQGTGYRVREQRTSGRRAAPCGRRGRTTRCWPLGAWPLGAWPLGARPLGARPRTPCRSRGPWPRGPRPRLRRRLRRCRLRLWSPPAFGLGGWLRLGLRIPASLLRCGVLGGGRWGGSWVRWLSACWSSVCLISVPCSSVEVLWVGRCGLGPVEVLWVGRCGLGRCGLG